MIKEEKEQNVFSEIFVLANKLQSFGDASLDLFTLRQYLLLSSIYNMNQDNLSYRQIADYIGTSRQNTIRQVDVLAKKGYLQVEASKTDARSSKVSLTDSGIEYMQEHGDFLNNLLSGVFRGVNEKELDSSLKMFEKIGSNLNVSHI